MKSLKVLLPLTFFALTSNSSLAANPENGKQLYQEANCIKCHAEKPHSKEKSPSLERLISAVSGCNDNFAAGWFEDEVEDVAAYLNDAFYNF